MALKTNSYQKVGGWRNSDPVVEQLPDVVIHQTTLLRGLRETHTNTAVAVQGIL